MLFFCINKNEPFSIQLIFCGLEPTTSVLWGHCLNALYHWGRSVIMFYLVLTTKICFLFNIDSIILTYTHSQNLLPFYNIDSMLVRRNHTHWASLNTFVPLTLNQLNQDPRSKNAFKSNQSFHIESYCIHISVPSSDIKLRLCRTLRTFQRNVFLREIKTSGMFVELSGGRK